MTQGKLTMNLNSYARMGNCLFQYAFMKAQALEKNMSIVLPAFCRELTAFPSILYDIGSVKDPINLAEKKFSYDKSLVDKISPEHNYSFSGYFQSYKYFEKYSDIILKDFQIDPKYENFAKYHYSLFSSGRKLCGVHIRLPDTRGEIGFIYAQPSWNFIFSAIEKIRQKNPDTRFVVCSSDMDECRRKYAEVFPADTIFLHAGKYEDFAFLSCCDNNIVTAGTYGWWAAYLNKNPNKFVVCMTPTFNPDAQSVKNNDESDYYPTEWICIKN